MEFANYLWDLSFDYDFSPYQMGCDKALKKLGFVKKVYNKIDKEYCWIYKGEEGWEDELHQS